jgi:hypothetical protein
LSLPRRDGQAFLHGSGQAGIILLLQRQVLLLDGQRRRRMLLQGEIVLWATRKQRAFLLPAEQNRNPEQALGRPV